MRRKVKINIRRITGGPIVTPVRYQIVSINGAVTVAGRTETFRAGDRIVEAQAEDLATVKHYEVNASA